MEIFRQLGSVLREPTVASIGNFDGVHLGHRSVLAETIARARALHARSLAITFDPHPTRLLRPEQPTPLITPLARKLELLAGTGIDATLVLPFTTEFCQTSARDFAEHVLREGIGCVEVHEGENFRFGYQAESGIGGENGLESLGRQLGFGVGVFAPLRLRGGPISSSRVRGLIAAGAMSEARALLGRAFAVDSTPASGRGFGTRYAVPTINLARYGELLPGHGVYITRLTVGAAGGETAGRTGATFQGVTNVGNRPTFGEDSFAVESHLLDFYPIALSEETPLRLEFLRRLRGERRFESPAALREQILRDMGQARRYFALCGALAARR
ncbi:MAG: bifunctional riboflavin kinase/FMN adenylyltransferase [Acidobacteriota bacterium]|nr:bifunctional riboflavin kinase/FMN adenylyltransferase [Acidobacteriota bacterium]